LRSLCAVSPSLRVSLVDIVAPLPLTGIPFVQDGLEDILVPSLLSGIPVAQEGVLDGSFDVFG